jgi:hypothetical protein
MLLPNGNLVILRCEDCGKVFRVVDPSRHTLAGLREMDAAYHEDHRCNVVTFDGDGNRILCK